MVSVARALGALLVIGTLFVPYTQPLFCSTQGPTPEAHEHTGHGAPQPAPDNQVNSGGHATPCHGAPTCGVSHVAPLRAGATFVVATAQNAAGDREPAAGLSTVLSATPPPPKR